MHWTTAKLIALDRVEGFLAQGWAQYSRVALAHNAKSLRRKLPAHMVAAYDEIKARHKEPVVGVSGKMRWLSDRVVGGAAGRIKQGLRGEPL